MITIASENKRYHRKVGISLTVIPITTKWKIQSWYKSWVLMTNNWNNIVITTEINI